VSLKADMRAWASRAWAGGKFRKRPVTIEAIHFVGFESSTDHALAIPANVKDFMGLAVYRASESGIVIPTLDGDHLARPGDWIIRGVKGELYPCKPDIFVMTYEPVV
jgi:hypothetical protein